MTEEYIEFLQKLCEETKKNIIAYDVTAKMKGHENESFRKTSLELREMLEDSFFTGLMVCMGYNMPKHGIYSLRDYSNLCGVLEEYSEDEYEIKA